ncbi:hypothetical protein J2Y69_001836 [Microbacterium resistens]|uniref:YdcF family protein n=1 Tax=Microbacterium resistens TaxID=156977 RepID=A0ABU1SCA1_9MICO|nr:ElyC/SanA/YdcF family protein [Microbacterium resistens]MDR6867235.1 hypothetical protein [Microbacterium resistens]
MKSRPVSWYRSECRHRRRGRAVSSEYPGGIIGIGSGVQGDRTSGRRWKRIAVRVSAWLSGIVLLIALAGVPIFVLPPSDETDGVDAVLVLGPPTGNRIDRAYEISAANGQAPIVISIAPDGQHSMEETGACRRIGVECLIPDTFTTKGEAELLNQLSAVHGWRTVAVITESPHVLRARYIFDRCYDGDARVVSVLYSGWILGWVFQYGYQTGAFVKAALTDCA